MALGIGVPLLVAVLWAMLIAPGAPVKLPGLANVALQVAVFGAAGAALFAARRSALAFTFGLIVVLNASLMLAWGQ